MDIRRIDPGPYLSSVVVAGDFVFLAGLVADDLAADVAGQTAQILGKIDHYLKKAGCDKSRIITAQIWLRDIAKWAEMNEIWKGWVDKSNPPARAAVEARLAGERILVEIMITAVRK